MSEPEKRILICNRVIDMPIPPALGVIKICTAGCLERVWVANSSPKNVEPVCMQCATKLLEEDPGPHTFEAPTAEQAFETLRWLSRNRRR
jgi:hypothetical protein